MVAPGRDGVMTDDIRWLSEFEAKNEFYNL